MAEFIGGLVALLVVVVVRALLPDRFVSWARPWAAIAGGTVLIGMGAFLIWAMDGDHAGCVDCEGLKVALFSWGIGLGVAFFGGSAVLRGLRELRRRGIGS